MEIPFRKGKFVSYDGEINYQEVLDDFNQAKIIRIITYNISKNTKSDKLLDKLENLDADIKLITNVPSRMQEYYNSISGNRMRNAAKNNIEIYTSKLNPDKFQNKFEPFFNLNNHAKIIGTENIVYIGSANYSNESANNIETGVIVRDKTFIKELYENFFDELKEDSLSYFDEKFNAFSLFVLSLSNKFEYHHKRLITDLYTDYERAEMDVAETIFLDVNDLVNLHNDLYESEDCPTHLHVLCSLLSLPILF